MLNELVKGVFFYGILGGLTKSISMILLPIYTRAFSPDKYGIIDTVTTVLSFLTIITMLQMEAAIGRYFYETKDVEERRQNLSTAFWTIFACSLFFMVCLVQMANKTSILLFDTAEFGSLFRIAAVILPCSNIFAFFVAIMRYLKRPILYGFCNLLQIISVLGFSILFVVQMEIGIAGAFYGQLLGYSITAIAIVCIALTHKIIGFYWEKDILIRYLKFSLPLLPGVFCGWLNSYINRFFMISHLTFSEIGVFAVSLRLASVFRLFEDAVKMSWGPFLYSSLEKENHKAVFKIVLLWSTVLVFYLVIVLSLFLEEIFTFLATREYFKGVSMTVILFLTFSINSLVQIVLIGPVITGKTYFNSILQLMGLLVNTVLLFILIPELKLFGVSLSLMFSSLTLFLSSWITTEKLYPVGFHKLEFVIIFGGTILAIYLIINNNIKFPYKVAIVFILPVIAMIVGQKYFVIIQRYISD